MKFSNSEKLNNILIERNHQEREEDKSIIAMSTTVSHSPTCFLTEWLILGY